MIDAKHTFVRKTPFHFDQDYEQQVAIGSIKTSTLVNLLLPMKKAYLNKIVYPTYMKAYF